MPPANFNLNLNAENFEPIVNSILFDIMCILSACGDSDSLLPRHIESFSNILKHQLLELNNKRAPETYIHQWLTNVRQRTQGLSNSGELTSLKMNYAEKTLNTIISSAFLFDIYQKNLEPIVQKLQLQGTLPAPTPSSSAIEYKI